MSNPDDPRPGITPSPNGPYLVKDVTDLSNSKGSLPTRPSMALCRCGQSANKPFCDGTHAKVGFSGEKLADVSDNKRVNHEGDGVTVHDNRAVCAHAGRCTNGLPAVFRVGWRNARERWMSPPTSTTPVMRFLPMNSNSACRSGTQFSQ